MMGKKKKGCIKILLCMIFFAVYGCGDAIKAGRDVYLQSGDNNKICPTCPDDDCPHPDVALSCASSINLDPTGCHGGVVPTEPLPETIPCN